MRYFKIIDGCSVTDIAKNESGEESGVLYNYYLYVRPGGSGVIMRENDTKTEYRFYPFSNVAQSEVDIDTLFANRQTLTYKRPSAMKKL
jgi:hypothetical protein